MDLTQTIIVYSAGVIGAITSFPQLYQIIKTEKVRDINPYFFVLHVLSDVLYLSYGILTKDTLLAISMSLPSVCNAAIFGLCLYYNENESIVEEETVNCDISCKDIPKTDSNVSMVKTDSSEQLIE